jgi:DNA (cytosine-5)-methyltransferase 1
MKLGSLFDGIGGFPLSASKFGIEPVWASEIEPFPIKVTKLRFPSMKHLGDITKINGALIEPVDLITFGSPCQDLSVAGKREGMKHQDKGDEATTRSGLFIEAIRIIKEMRYATNGLYPRISLWENVPGAFSSNKGRDFCAVLEETLKEASGQSTIIPMPPKGKWLTAGCIMGDNYSIAWRVVDAQYYGVPQRRRRIILVTDFRGQTAPEILFEPESMCRNTQEGWEQGEVATFGVGRSFEETNGRVNTKGRCSIDTNSKDEIILNAATPKTLLIRGGSEGGGKGALIQDNKSSTLSCVNNQTLFEPLSIQNHPQDSRVDVNPSGKVQTLTKQMGTGGGNVPLVAQIRDIAPTVTAKWHKGSGGPSGNECGNLVFGSGYAVRRLTPLECERLQGFPDGWTKIPNANDTVRYKALGNSIAVTCFYPYIERIRNVIKFREGEIDE